MARLVGAVVWPALSNSDINAACKAGVSGRRATGTAPRLITVRAAGYTVMVRGRPRATGVRAIDLAHSTPARPAEDFSVQTDLQQRIASLSHFTHGGHMAKALTTSGAPAAPTPTAHKVDHGFSWKAVAPVLVTVVLTLIPAPEGLAPHVLFGPAELARPGFKAANASLSWALSGFANTTVWLIFAAFMFALGCEKTGLGRRTALSLVKMMGRRTLTLGIMGILTPYATGPSPVYYGSGYIPAKDYRRLGTIFGVLYLVALLAIGVPWLLM
jgi:hypothetical protein